MKYVSIAVITTGTDIIKNDLLEVSAIVEDTKNLKSFDDCPKIRRWIDKEFYRGNPANLVIQQPILETICKHRKINSKQLIVPDEVTMHFTKFLQPHFSEGSKFTKPINVAGFQFSTQAAPFLNRFPNFKNIPFNLNPIELSDFFIDWNKDIRPPTFGDCLTRCGLKEEEKLMDSMFIAWNVIQMLRTKYSQFMPSGLKKMTEKMTDIPSDFASVISNNFAKLLK